jgi:hypothetical protein
LNIQQLAYQYYPGVQIRPDSLQQIVIVGKGWNESTTVDLMMDGQFADHKVLPGRADDYYKNDYNTYYSTSMVNSWRTGARNWDLNFRGAARVLTVTVYMIDQAPQPPPYIPGRIENIDIGTERTQKLISTTKSFRPQRWDDVVNNLIITDTVEKVLIQKVVVVFSDGYSQEFPELAQKMNPMQQIGVFLQNRRISEIQITSTCGNFAGSRAEYKVTLAVLR